MQVRYFFPDWAPHFPVHEAWQAPYSETWRGAHPRDSVSVPAGGVQPAPQVAPLQVRLQVLDCWPFEQPDQAPQDHPDKVPFCPGFVPVASRLVPGQLAGDAERVCVNFVPLQ